MNLLDFDFIDCKYCKASDPFFFLRRIPITETYTLNGLYPNTLYYIWLAARSQRGEGATTPPIAVRTKQYGMWWSGHVRGRRELVQELDALTSKRKAFLYLFIYFVHFSKDIVIE